MKSIRKGFRKLFGVKELYTVIVRYKSGQSVTVRCREFTVKTDGLGNITAMTWNIPAGLVGPINVGINNVESVWQEFP